MDRNNTSEGPEQTECGPEEVRTLIAELSSKNRDARSKAHDSLVSLGEPAVLCLVEALADSSERVRWEAMKTLDEMNVPWRRHADAATIRALVADLGSNDGLVSVRARRALVTIGARAVKPLAGALASPRETQRWESAKALGQIGDPAAIDALLAALEDQAFDVRWLAAEGLAAIGQRALSPLLRQLIAKSDSLWFREGAHHVLHGMGPESLWRTIRPVLSALEDADSPVETPVAAREALEKVEKRSTKRVRP